MDAEGGAAAAGHVGSAGIIDLIRIQLVHLFLLDKAALMSEPLFGQILPTTVPHFLLAFVEACLTFALLGPEIEDL